MLVTVIDCESSEDLVDRKSLISVSGSSGLHTEVTTTHPQGIFLSLHRADNGVNYGRLSTVSSPALMTRTFHICEWCDRFPVRLSYTARVHYHTPMGCGTGTHSIARCTTSSLTDGMIDSDHTQLMFSRTVIKDETYPRWIVHCGVTVVSGRRKKSLLIC